MTLLRSIKKVLQDYRGILCMYPEARYSPIGTTAIGGKNFPLAQGRSGGVVAFEAAVVDIDAFHKVFPPFGRIPERFLPFLPVYHRNNRKANPISGNFQHDFQKGGCQKRAPAGPQI